jgi:hypothetical protein
MKNHALLPIMALVCAAARADSAAPDTTAPDAVATASERQGVVSSPGQAVLTWRDPIGHPVRVVWTDASLSSSFLIADEAGVIWAYSPSPSVTQVRAVNFLGSSTTGTTTGVALTQFRRVVPPSAETLMPHLPFHPEITLVRQGRS